jgi:O-6-methylguanine DNA methyltransferase
MMILATYIDTPIGQMVAGAMDNGVCLLEFMESKALKKDMHDLSIQWKAEFTEGENFILEKLKIQLGEYFNGLRKEFNVPLIISGTLFQKKVWEELMNIPFGLTQSYSNQYRAINKTGSIRAVASANGRNKICIIIPCHRVIGSNGQLSGYSGGLIRKKWLLDHERKHSEKYFDMSLF